MIVNKLMSNSISIKIQDLAMLFVGCDKTNMRELSSAVFSSFCLPFGKAEDTPSPSLPRVRGRSLQPPVRSAYASESFTLGRLGSACPVKCLPNEMRRIFHRGEAYFSGGASSTFDQLRSKQVKFEELKVVKIQSNRYRKTFQLN